MAISSEAWQVGQLLLEDFQIEGKLGEGGVAEQCNVPLVVTVTGT